MQKLLALRGPICDHVYSSPRSELGANDLRHRNDGVVASPNGDATVKQDVSFHEVRIFGWNLGGALLDTVGPALGEVCGGPLRADDLVMLQEAPRRAAGWSRERVDGRLVVTHRQCDQWRGVGLSFCETAWAMIKKVPAGFGAWFRMRHLRKGVELWLGSFHFTPGTSIPVFEDMLGKFLAKRPVCPLPIIVQGDVNAHFAWSRGDRGDELVCLTGRGLIFRDRTVAAGMTTCPPVRAHQDWPTSRPRQEGRDGHHIDVFLTQRAMGGRVEVLKDSYMLIGSDHEALVGSFKLRVGKGRQRHCTGPRVWCGNLEVVNHLDQEGLEQLARTRTKPRPGMSYKDPEHVKELLRNARVARTAKAWKQAQDARRQARKAWELARLERAAEGDWMAFRAAARQGPVGWEIGYAEAQSADVHQSVHKHLEGVYSSPEFAKWPDTNPTVTPFELSELSEALASLKSGKSVGIDLTSKELLDGLVQTPGGDTHLLEYMNRVLTTRCIPPQWNRPLVILLPKVPDPTLPSQLRPIALGSSASKLFSKMILARIKQSIGFQSHSQCAGPGRQATDFLFALHRVLELSREWGLPVAFLKIDISKAFDSLKRKALLQRVHERLGTTAEFLCLQALLTDVRATLQSAWGSSSFRMGSGIKQGAAESPQLFSFIMEVALCETSQEHGWGKHRRLLPELAEADLLFMDDGVLWARSCDELQAKIQQFAGTLERYGLLLNMKKCQLYCTPACAKPHLIRVGGVALEGRDSMEVMGLRMAQGMPVTKLIQPLLARAQTKFWSLKQLASQQNASGA